MFDPTRPLKIAWRLPGYFYLCRYLERKVGGGGSRLCDNEGMNFTMITPYHNHDNVYISLVIKDFVALPDEVIVGQKTLYRKSEFHISLMALKNLLPLINTVNADVNEADLVQDFLEYQSGIELSAYTLTNELRYVKRDERETVIAIVDVPNIDGLFERLREKYNVDVPTQPTHITLYTLQPEAGIGILSQEELERDSSPIELPEIHLN